MHVHTSVFWSMKYFYVFSYTMHEIHRKVFRILNLKNYKRDKYYVAFFRRTPNCVKKQVLNSYKQQ